MTQLLLLEDDGTTKCRKPLQSIVDQSTIKGDGEGTKFALDMSVVAAALNGDGIRDIGGKIDADLVVDAPLSGAGRSDSHLKIAAATNTNAGVMPHTGAGNIPADMDRDVSDISPAAVKKMFDYIKPVGVSGNLDVSQLSQDAIEVPMLSGVSCTGGTNGNPKFTIPMENGGKCDIDLGALKGYGGGGGTTVWEGLSNGCISLAGKGAGMYIAYLRYTWDERDSGIYIYYAVPFFFFDVPDLFESKAVAIDYRSGSPDHMKYRPNMCSEITGRLYTEATISYGSGSGASYIFAPNIVYQTFRSFMIDPDRNAGRAEHVYKVVKVS